jgi:cytochrome b-561 domain-containing protein 2
VPISQTFGLITVSWLVLQSALGAGSVWFDGAAFGGGHKAKLVWKYHRLSGYILLLCLLVTVNLGGAWSTWTSSNSAYIVRLVAYTLAPLGILVSIYSRVRYVAYSLITIVDCLTSLCRPSKMKFF